METSPTDLAASHAAIWTGRIGVAIYGFAIVLQAAIFKMILDNTSMSVYQLLFLRGVAQTFLTLPFIRKSQVQFISNNNRWMDIIVWTIVHTIWVTALHMILDFGLIGSSMSILALGQFGSIILARIFLKEELRYIHFPMFIMCFVGIILILQPTFLFGGEEMYTQAQSICIYSFVIVVSIGFMWVRKLKGIPVPMNCEFEAIALVVVNLTVALIVGWNDLDLRTVCFGLAFGLYALIANVLFYYATPLIPVAETAFIRSLDKVWGYLLDFLVMSEPFRWNAIIGSGIILIAMILLACTKIESKPEEKSVIEESKGILTDTSPSTSYCSATTSTNFSKSTASPNSV